MLTWVYPPGLVDRVVAACGRAEHRRRLLPARLVVYFVLALALFSPAPYLEVMRHLVEGLRGQGLLGEWRIPAKSSLFRARQRLGPEPLRVLFATTAKPMGTEATPGCFWRGLRLLAVDGTCWDVADSPANEAAFGRPGNSRGHDKSCFPQVRMACLIEVGTHLVLDAELAGCRTGEVTLVSRLPRSCDAGQLVLADREFLGVPLWRAFTAGGADLLWRVPANRVLPVERMLRDGSWLSRIHARTDPAHRDPVTVRVVAYQLHGTGRAAEDYRLVTTLLDARRYPARQLAALYHERWEAEAVFAELKTHQRGARTVLSSKTPDGVLQQIWAHLLVHHALRELMVRTAATRGLDADRVSFTETLRSARRSVTLTPGSFSP
ncbi:IS4 family transposase [Streptomyces sp. Li-HN-5-11]|uniref:IS4 family transposase n=1 Tax=Streptomyces sp. Li-HN-5-11 TaxID=3075432 RepID=UPI0028AA21EC|nr:IS4 family transposase [Streptomyces sp. Li-HN-5-11]WNM30935.1 IS4 family transposase [Streptomyces sp. Li-HN-5-11]